MRGFSIRRDIKHVQWGPTLQVAFVRSFGMALTMVIVFLNAILQGRGNEIAGITSGTDAVLFLGFLFIAYVVSATLLYPILGFISWYLTSLYVYFPIFGFFGIFYITFTCAGLIGDPFAFFLHKLKPRWVPVDNYNFLNFVPIVFVLDPDYVSHLQMTGQVV